MSEIKSEKPNIHISATPEVSQLLGLHKVIEDGHNMHAPASKKAHEPVNLPVVDSEVTSKGVVDSHAASASHSPVLTAANSSHDLSHEIETLEEAAEKQAPWKKAIKTLAPYLAVFVVGLALYYFFLSKTDLSTVLDKIKPVTKTAVNQKETALQALEKQNLQSYRTWIAQYYFDVSDVKIIEPNADNSGNGLSNFQKYLLGLNPRSYDTLGLNMADSQALAAGINPLTGNTLTDQQKQILDKYFDMEVIMNRLALSNLNNSRNNIAGASVNSLNNQANIQQSQNNQSGAGVNALGGQPNIIQNNNYNNNINGTLQNNNSYTAPKTGANSMLFGEDSDIDQTKPGQLEIPSLKISVPVIWTQDSKNFDADLQSGVVHYPGTALPGQVGTTYISGHSSNYVWAKGSYNRVFSKLGDLADNSSFVITVYNKQGKTIKYHYVVTRRAEFKATDQAQFENSGTGTVALSTCWPVNTTQKRLVVFGELTQTER